jgi:hypothetical protein
MDGERTPPIVYVYFATWAVLILASLVFRYTAPIPLRQKLRVPITLVVGALFSIFLGIMMGPEKAIVGILPVGLIIAMNIRGTRICSNCGTENRNPNIFAFTPPLYCQKCGTKHEG